MGNKDRGSFGTETVHTGWIGWLHICGSAFSGILIGRWLLFDYKCFCLGVHIYPGLAWWSPVCLRTRMHFEMALLDNGLSV
jgi:hypothetical protein